MKEFFYLNRVALAVSLVLSATPGIARDLSGSGTIETIDGSSPAETWNVTDGARLIMLPGSTAITGPGTNPWTLRAANGGQITADGITLNSYGRGVLLVQGNISLNNSVINTADTNTGSALIRDYVSGVALNVTGGTASVAGSTLNGGRTAISVFSDRAGTGNNLVDMDISDSELISGTGSLILIGNTSQGVRIPSELNIILRDGTTTSAGNGTLLDVRNDSTANLTISNSDISGNIVSGADATTNVDIRDSGWLRGATDGVDTINVASASGWEVTGDSDVDTLSNSGTVQFSSGSAGRTLTVNGDYTGNDGLVVFNSVLGGDDSLTDKLVVNGDTSGNTFVSVNNLGGSGASTLNGIELIEVNGNSAGDFTQKGRIVAGAYDYRLIKGGSNWYLTSDQNVTPDPDPDPNPGPDPDPNPEPDPDPNPGPAPQPSELTLRPEGGAYGANLAATATLFDSRLSDRQGTDYTDPVTGELRYTSLWLHQTGGHTRAHDSTGQLRTTGNRYVAMLGGDIGSGSGAGGSWRVGAMAGYGNSRSNTVSGVTGYRAKGEVSGYTTGLYGTWYAEGTEDRGLYADTVLQYSWFRNSVSGEDVSTERYDASGMSASVEAGYVVPLSQSERTSVYLQPQMQVTWSGVSADNHTEQNGTRITGDAENNVRSRVGLKAFMKTHSPLDDTTGRRFRPYVEANWLHNTERYGVSMDGVTVTQAGTRNIAEVRAGLEGNLTSRLSLSGSIGQQAGDNGWSDTSASVGMRYSF